MWTYKLMSHFDKSIIALSKISTAFNITFEKRPHFSNYRLSDREIGSLILQQTETSGLYLFLLPISRPLKSIMLRHCWMTILNGTVGKVLLKENK